MSTRTLGMPSDLRQRLESGLPSLEGCGRPVVRVTPRDADERRCPAYAADHYEVQVYYTTTSTDALDKLENAIRAVPGVYATTQAHAGQFTNPDWPPPLGTARRNGRDLRPQVMALIRGTPSETANETTPGAVPPKTDMRHRLLWTQQTTLHDSIAGILSAVVHCRTPQGEAFDLVLSGEDAEALGGMLLDHLED